MDTPSTNTRSQNRKRSVSSHEIPAAEFLQLPIPKKRRRKSIKRKSLLDTVILMKEQVSSANNSPCQSKKKSLLKDTATPNVSPKILEATKDFGELEKDPAYYTFFQKHKRLSDEGNKWKALLKKYETEEQEIKFDHAYPFANKVEKDIERNRSISNKETLNYRVFSKNIYQLQKILKVSVLSVTNTLQAIYVRNKDKSKAILIPEDEKGNGSEFNDFIKADPRHLVINLTKINTLIGNVTEI